MTKNLFDTKVGLAQRASTINRHDSTPVYTADFTQDITIQRKGDDAPWIKFTIRNDQNGVTTLHRVEFQAPEGKHYIIQVSEVAITVSPDLYHSRVPNSRESKEPQKVDSPVPGSFWLHSDAKNNESGVDMAIRLISSWGFGQHFDELKQQVPGLKLESALSRVNAPAH